MAHFSASHQTAAGATLVLLNLTGAATIRANIYQWTIGSDATPADLAGEFNLMRTTTAGAGGTSLGENAGDPLVIAAVAAATGGTFTSVPTVTANSDLEQVGLNQRATYSWTCAYPGRELITAATAANGIAVYCRNHGGTPNVNTTLKWFE